MAGTNHVKTVLETKQIQWLKLRAAVITDDAAVLAVTNRNFANRNIGTGDAVQVPAGINEIVVTFIGKPADQTSAFTATFYVFRAKNGPAEKVCVVTGNIGDVAVVVHPISGSADATLYYADYLNISSQNWQAPVRVIDVGASSGEIAKLAFDLCGAEWVLCELTNCDAGTANETDSLEAIYTGC
jgi:hypothetical protein